jgi:hypothetical protein
VTELSSARDSIQILSSFSLSSSRCKRLFGGPAACGGKMHPKRATSEKCSVRGHRRSRFSAVCVEGFSKKAALPHMRWAAQAVSPSIRQGGAGAHINWEWVAEDFNGGGKTSHIHRLPNTSATQQYPY